MTTFPSTRAVSVDAGIDRVMVGGKDITWFRTAGVMGPHMPTMVPGYTLIEPFAYGASQALVIPRTNSLFETYGTGDMSWLKKGAPVLYQRVDADGDLIATDYRGIVLSVRSSGREWVAEVGGELTARASMFHRQSILIRKVFDLGNSVHFGLKSIGMAMSPPSGPTTNIHAAAEGDMTLLSWLQKLCVLSQTASTTQRTIMPVTWGGRRWAFSQKDVETVDFTLFADGQRISVDLVDDLQEQPNTIFGNGVTPSGERWRGAAYPGFFQGPPAPYPFADTSTTFGIGTTDADTDTGDGITIMRIKLALAGYLDDALSAGDEYTSEVADAVDRLKDDAGLPENGTMTFGAWGSLWDTDVVGFDTDGATILPLTQATVIRYYNRSPTGGILSLNEHHQRGAIRVDRTIDFGVCEEGTARAYARSIRHDPGGHEWAGTVTLNSVSVFEGEHDSADAASLTSADLMPARDIRPGMNAWLPYFDGGTLVHVSMVDVSPGNGGDTVTLTVDTGASDYFDITQALQRNQDSKRDITREWQVANRGARPPGNFVAHDKLFGKLGQDVTLSGGHWNVVPVVMGQSGQVSRTLIRLTGDATEFCYAVFSKKMYGTSMDGSIGNPFNTDDDGLTVWEQTSMDDYFEERTLLTIQGQGTQPCGYYWRKGYGAEPEPGVRGDRTANPLTGSVLDDSPWPYITDPTNKAVVYLCIWPVDDCTLQSGRLFYALEDDAT